MWKDIGKCDPYPGVKTGVETDHNLTQMLGLVDKDLKASSKSMFKDLKNIYSLSKMKKRWETSAEKWNQTKILESKVQYNLLSENTGNAEERSFS